MDVCVGKFPLRLLNTDTAQKMKFPLRISSVNMSKFAGNCGVGRIY